MPYPEPPPPEQPPGVTPVQVNRTPEEERRQREIDDAYIEQQAAEAQRPHDNATGDLWIGRGRAIGETDIGRRGRAAFSPMDNRRIAGGFDPFADTRYRGVYQDARDMGRDAGRSRSTLEYMLGQTFEAPQYQAPGAYRPERVGTQTPGASLDYSRANVMDVNRAMNEITGSRVAQEGVMGTALDWAQGQMPSVGRDVANEAGVVANEQFLRAGSEANQAYGLASAESNRAYQDALAQQNFATQQAAQNAARTIGESSSDAVLRQAALVAGAREGGIGLATRGAQNNAALQAASAGRDASRIMSDADQQAAFLAAQGQRAAMQAQTQQGLATQGAQERAASAAAAAEMQARLRGAQIGSQEQQNMLGLSADIAANARSADIGAVGAAVDAGQFGLGMDTLATNANQSDANRMLEGDVFNASQAQQNAQFGQQIVLDYDTLNAQNIMNTNALNSQNWNASAGRFQGDQQFGLGMQQGMVQFDQQAEQALAAAQMGSEQELVQLLAGLDENSRNRMLQEFAYRMEVLRAQDAAANASRGQWMQLGGAGLGAAATIGAGLLGGFIGGSETGAAQEGFGGESGGGGFGGTADGGAGAQSLDPTYDPYGYGGGRQ